MEKEKKFLVGVFCLLFILVIFSLFFLKGYKIYKFILSVFLNVREMCILLYFFKCRNLKKEIYV